MMSAEGAIYIGATPIAKIHPNSPVEGQHNRKVAY